MLAIGRDLSSVPDVSPRHVSLNERYYYQQELQNHFWARWMREYLPSLTLRQKWTQEMTPLKENDVVLITDDNISRGRWRLGKVTQTYPGADGLIRTVRLQTKEGQVNRPVQRLHLLEEFRESAQLSPRRAQTEKQQDQPQDRQPSSNQVPQSSKQQDQPQDRQPSSNQVPKTSKPCIDPLRSDC